MSDETSLLEAPPDVDVIIEDQTPPQQPDSLQSRRANQFLFIALDVLTPARKRTSKRFQFGGHEVISECLGHTWGFVQKGRLTPLTMGGEPILEENVPEWADGFFPMSVAPKTDIPGALIMQGSDSPVGAIPAYPGDHLSSIMNGSSSEIDGRKIGLVKIRALSGRNYKIEQLAPGLRVDRDIWAIQRYFFPGFPRVPVRLVEFRDLITEGYNGTQDSALRSIAEDMLTSCEIGSLWANETIDSKERLIAQSRGHQGYAYVYDELDETLLAQLGREKVEQGATKMVEQFAAIAQTGRADIAELANAITTGNREFAEILLKGLQAQQAEKAEQPKSQAAPPATKQKT